MDPEQFINQQNELVQSILGNLEIYKEEIQAIQRENEKREISYKEQISKYQTEIDECRNRINGHQREEQLEKCRKRIVELEKVIEKKQTLLDNYLSRSKTQIDRTTNYIAELTTLKRVTLDDYKDDKESENIKECVKIINSINDFYKKNYANPEMKVDMNTISYVFKMNNNSILTELKEKNGDNRGVLDGRREFTISPRIPSSSGKGKRKWKTKTNKNCFRKKHSTKKHGRRKRN
jgi:hypothetical protein